MSQYQSFPPGQHRKRPSSRGAKDLSNPGGQPINASPSQPAAGNQSSSPVRRSAFARRNNPVGQQPSPQSRRPVINANQQNQASGPNYATSGYGQQNTGYQDSQGFINPQDLLPRNEGTPGRSILAPKKGWKRTRRTILALVVVFLVVVIAWPVGLWMWGNSLLEHTAPLPADSKADDSGTTFLIMGTDKRSARDPDSGKVSGGRADSIILLHVAPNGQASTVSIPRDTLVKIPGKNRDAKINATYSYGGEPMLAKAVENLTGMKVDHMVVITMDGVSDLIDAVGGIEYCMDHDVVDHGSGLHWKAGCHHTDGKTALQLARSRYSDRLGDFGRAKRQREIIGITLKKVATTRTFLDPFRQINLMKAGTGVLLTDPDTGIGSIGYLGWYYRKANAAGLSGIPPIASMGHYVRGLGSTVLLDQKKSIEFWAKMRAGTLTKKDYNSYG